MLAITSVIKKTEKLFSSVGCLLIKMMWSLTSVCGALSRRNHLRVLFLEQLIKPPVQAGHWGCWVWFFEWSLWLALVSEANFYLSLCNWKGLHVLKSIFLSFSRLLKGRIELGLVTIFSLDFGDLISCHLKRSQLFSMEALIMDSRTACRLLACLLLSHLKKVIQSCELELCCELSSSV